MQSRSAGTAAGTRRSPSLGALCGGLACLRISRNTCRPAPLASASRRNTCPPADLLFSLLVPLRRGGCVSLDFTELPTHLGLRLGVRPTKLFYCILTYPGLSRLIRTYRYLFGSKFGI